MSLFAFALATVAHAAAPFDCDLTPVALDTVVDTDGYQTPNDLAKNGYDYNKPLFLRNFTVTSLNPSCVMVQLSLHTLVGWGFGDEYAAVQVRIDRQPMYGHTTACTDNTGAFVPCLLLANNTDGVTPIGSHSYHFVLPNITPGVHELSVVYAGVDTDGNPTGAYVGGSIASIFHE